MKTVAYLRVSTRLQDPANQKLAILKFSQKRRFPIDPFIESRLSFAQESARAGHRRDVGTLQPGDRLLVSELSRLGRSLGQVIQIVETLARLFWRTLVACTKEGKGTKGPAAARPISEPPNRAIRATYIYRCLPENGGF